MASTSSSTSSFNIIRQVRPIVVDDAIHAVITNGRSNAVIDISIIKVPPPPTILRPLPSSQSKEIMATARPSGLIATKGIELLTWNTPNGYKASVLLEELKEAYGTQYTWQGVDISKNIQKEPWFLAVNPNGRIPAIVDHDNGDLAVFEGNAILGYLARRYDKDLRFSFAVDDPDYTRAESWIGWQHGGIGPM